MRKKIKHDYRLFDPIRKLLEKRDRPRFKIRDPLESAGRSDPYYDAFLVTPGAVNLGSRAGADRNDPECGCN